MRLIKYIFRKYRSDSLCWRFARNSRASKGTGTYFTLFQKFIIRLFEDEPYAWEQSNIGKGESQ